MSEYSGDGASSQPVRATGQAEARPSHQSGARPSAVLLDFHNTLAVVRSVDEWIDEASDLIAGGPAPGAIPRERIRNVWVDARRLFPALDWDLDPTAHRHAFVSTLSRDDAIPIDVAEALYAVMPNQWMLNAGASDFVARASAAGTRLGIVSNIVLRGRLCETRSADLPTGRGRARRRSDGLPHDRRLSARRRRRCRLGNAVPDRAPGRDMASVRPGEPVANHCRPVPSLR
jgi:hypothetical protein